ncbi:YopX family protein [Prescottella equi]|uniref:YopX family protein n=1 Tax=Rhodococcus hoagii TaxID=43767 RepID=UPI001F5B21D8|nr:YopX family protein [Prescottella equi]UNQ40914.1 YopX family protein [Prescottella equi]
MTREIKFRLWLPDWDGETGKMFYRPLPLDPDFKSFGLALDDNQATSFDTEFSGEVMQYTGLKDKNGVEIYEGDVMKTDYFLHDDKTFCVIYIERIGAFNAIDNHDDGYGLSDMRWEVIGNIHENPVLLKREDQPDASAA